MKKKILATMLALFAIAMTAGAQKEKYDLYVGGVQVNSNNCSNITGGGISSGKAVYDATTRTLTLTNINIVRTHSGSEGITSGMNPLTIKFIGNGRVVTGAAASLRLNKTTTVDIAAGTTVTLSSDDDVCLYLDNGSATEVVFTGTGTLKMEQTKTGTIRYTQGVVGKHGSEKVTFNGPTVIFSTHRGCLWKLGEVNFRGGSVELGWTITGDPQVYSVKKMNFFNDQHISAPLGAFYDSSRQTIEFKKGTPYYGDKGYTNELKIQINNKFAAKVNSTYFPDANFRSHVSTNFDLNKDGYISALEVGDDKAVKRIDIEKKGITNLKGIECFTSLTYLNCSGNSLTSLDISKNTKLQTVVCDNNKLTTINVSGSTALETLWCNNNQLTSLDISKNTKLTDLRCHVNKISGSAMQTLVNGLPKVSSGFFYAIDTRNGSEQNVITKAQVTTAKNKGWTVRDNYGGSPKDYAGSDPGIAINPTNFPDANFRSFVSGTTIDKDKDGYLSPTEIDAVTKIDVCQKNISNLKGIEYFTALTRFDCDRNKVTSLDVSKLTKLQILRFEDNQITKIDLSKNTALINLYCYNNKLTALDVSKNTKLTTLWCYGNKINSTAMQMLVNSLPKVTSGDFMVVNTKNSNEGNVITKAQVTVAKNKGWRVRDDNGGSYVDYAGLDLGIAINATNFPDANFRNFVSTSIDKDEDGYLSTEEIAAVTKIDVYNKAVKNLKGIEHFTAITSLDCRKNQLSALNLSKNTALTELLCTNNHLTALSVANNTELTMLECSENELTALDLSKNTKLNILYIDGNQIKGDKMQAFVNSLPKVVNGVFCPIDTKNSAEQNVITKAQVTTAKGKGWKVYDYFGGSHREYAGSEGSVANGKVGGTRVWANAGILYIYVTETSAHVQIYDLAGALVADKNAPSGQSTISDLPRGIYVVRIGNKAEKISLK